MSHEETSVGTQRHLCLTLQRADRDVEYKEHDERSANYWGQLKLMLGELLFLHPYVTEKDVRVVYAGASPGQHLRLLVSMMPSSWTWDLYDASRNDSFSNEPFQSFQKKSKRINSDKALEIASKEQVIEGMRCRHLPPSYLARARQELYLLQHTHTVRPLCEPDRVRVHARYLQEAEARQIRIETPRSTLLLFISDIRTCSSEEAVMGDMELQKSLVLSLMPHQASLKFKLPYSEVFNQPTTYLDGDLMLQGFCKRNSHETRLFTLLGDHITREVEYYPQVYNNDMNYHQQHIRRAAHHDLDVADTSHQHLHSRGVAVDRCFDCTWAKHVLGKLYGMTLGEMDLLIGQLDAACI